MARFGDTASGEVLTVLDTRLVDQNVEVWVALCRLRGETLDVCRIALIQGQPFRDWPLPRSSAARGGDQR